MTGAAGAVVRLPRVSRVSGDVVLVPAGDADLAAATGVQSLAGWGTVCRQGGAGGGGSIYHRSPIHNLAPDGLITSRVVRDRLAGAHHGPVLHPTLLGHTGTTASARGCLVLVTLLAVCLTLTDLITHFSLSLSISEGAVGYPTKVSPPPPLSNLINIPAVPAGDLLVVRAAPTRHLHLLQDVLPLVFLHLTIIAGLH